jgi:hypothetical protein
LGFARVSFSLLSHFRGFQGGLGGNLHPLPGPLRFQRIKAFSAAAKRVAQMGRQQHDGAL